MKKLYRLMLIALLTGTSFMLAANSPNHFDTVVTFGDSLSDNGNLYRYTLHYVPISPPYFEGRFSNGPVWVEQFYQKLFANDATGMQDYAVGGAGAILSYKENLPFTLGFEIDDYYYWNTYDHIDTTLYVIWIGGNNYLNGPTEVDSITTKVVDAIGSNIESLISHGGNKFLIINIPNLSHSPEGKESGFSELLDQLSKTHNKKLSLKFQTLKHNYPQVKFLYFDIDHYLTDMMLNPQHYGIENTREPCYLGGYSNSLLPDELLNPSDDALTTYLKQTKKELNQAYPLSAVLANPALRESVRVAFTRQKMKQLHLIENHPPECSRYLFWDHVHPTAKVHQAIADEIHKLVKQAGLQALQPSTAVYPGLNA